MINLPLHESITLIVSLYWGMIAGFGFYQLMKKRKKGLRHG